MLERDIQVIIRLNEKEFQKLKRDAKKTGYTQTRYVRSLLSGYIPKEQAGERFYEVMGQLTTICDSMSRIARKAEAMGDIDAEYYKAEAEALLDFKLEVRRHYILPDKIK